MFGVAGYKKHKKFMTKVQGMPTLYVPPFSNDILRIEKPDLTEVTYNHISGETLESLADKFSELVDDHQKLSGKRFHF